jgi:hypothetical protein
MVLYAHVLPMLTSDKFVVIVLFLGAEGVPQIVKAAKWSLADSRHSVHDQWSGHGLLIGYDGGASSMIAST